MADASYDFGVSSIFGTLTGWLPQGNATITKAKDRASVDNGMGDEAASKLHNGRTEVSQSFKGADPTVAPTVPPVIGGLMGGYLVTRIELGTTGTDVPTMTITGHQHDANAHGNDRRQATHGITVPAFGAKDFLGGTLSAVEVTSSKCVIEVQHVDVTGQSGEHAAGENYKGMLTVSQDYLGDATTEANLTASGWDVTPKTQTPQQANFETSSVTAVKAFALATPE